MAMQMNYNLKQVFSSKDFIFSQTPSLTFTKFQTSRKATDVTFHGYFNHCEINSLTRLCPFFKYSVQNNCLNLYVNI